MNVINVEFKKISDFASRINSLLHIIKNAQYDNSYSNFMSKEVYSQFIEEEYKFWIETKSNIWKINKSDDELKRIDNILSKSMFLMS